MGKAHASLGSVDSSKFYLPTQAEYRRIENNLRTTLKTSRIEIDIGMYTSALYVCFHVKPLTTELITSIAI